MASKCLRTRILYAPSKAANAGGVAVSGLEMSQNSARIAWTEELERLLEETMKSIHDSCAEYGQDKDHVDYLREPTLPVYQGG